VTVATNHSFVSETFPTPLPTKWYAVHTRAKHERKVAVQLVEKGISAFVPTIRETHLWSDRRQLVEVPLFLCYVFVNVMSWQRVHGQVLRTPGLLRWVGVNGEPTAIPDSQIDAVRCTLANDLSVSSYPFLKLGQRVRVRGGCLDGVEGILVGKDKNSRLILSIDLIQQSLSVALQGYDFEPA
jgi:transcription antitermination factor NusG